jgi:hypothetical protein
VCSSDLRLSVQGLIDAVQYKPAQGIELLTMHFCFAFKDKLSKYDREWAANPSAASNKLKELTAKHGLYCPIHALLPLTFG